MLHARSCRYSAAGLFAMMLVSPLSQAQVPPSAPQNTEEQIEAPLADPLAISIKSCQLGASGDGCVLDLRASANGTLQVCTKSRRNLDRWRASIAQTLVGGAVSAVGTGSATAFTGCVTRSVVAGSSYEVLVNYAAPAWYLSHGC